LPSKDDKARRKALLRGLAAQAQSQAEAAMPISLLEPGDLFDFLDSQLENGCGHTLERSKKFLEVRGLYVAQVLQWLGESGGFCDGEVLANVEEAWTESIQRARLESGPESEQLAPTFCSPPDWDFV